MVNKKEIKVFLIISYVILEVLSMTFNAYFFNVDFVGYHFCFNFSVIFFCLSFFIVDIVNDFYSIEEADMFVYYKFYGQILFIVMGNFALQLYQINSTEIARILNESPYMILCSFISTFVGYKIMSRIMIKIKSDLYRGNSIFFRYVNTTIPGEFAFTLIFSILNFSSAHRIDEMINIISTSCVVKIILSLMFASLMTLFYKIKIFYSKKKELTLKSREVILRDI